MATQAAPAAPAWLQPSAQLHSITISLDCHADPTCQSYAVVLLDNGELILEGNRQQAPAGVWRTRVAPGLFAQIEKDLRDAMVRTQSSHCSLDHYGDTNIAWQRVLLHLTIFPDEVRIARPCAALPAEHELDLAIGRTISRLGLQSRLGMGSRHAN
jgi:hypothetical protein